MKDLITKATLMKYISCGFWVIKKGILKNNVLFRFRRFTEFLEKLFTI